MSRRRRLVVLSTKVSAGVVRSVRKAARLGGVSASAWVALAVSFALAKMSGGAR